MPYHTIKILRDKEGRPIPQVYDPEIDSFVPATIHQNVSDANVLNELKKLNENNGVSHTAYNKSIDALGKSEVAQLNSITALEEATEAKTTANVVKDQFNQVVAEAGSNNPEVVLARGGEANLNSRLNKINTNLAQKLMKGEVTRKDLKTSSDADLLDLSNFNEATRSVLQGLTVGEVNAVLGIGNVKSENIAPNAITPEHIPFLEAGTNLWDTSRDAVGLLAHQTGEVGSGANYRASEFIRMKKGITYSIQWARKVAWFDVDKKFVSGLDGGYSTHTFTAEYDGILGLVLQPKILVLIPHILM